jgi:hypothetical protein
MIVIIKKYKINIISFIFLFGLSMITFGQNDTDTFRMKLAIGLNNPIDDGKNDGYYSKRFNSPTIDFGFQYMFNRTVGAKFDIGFNRASNAPKSLMFKLNYTRINIQIIYDFTNFLNILPENFYSQVHFGPGISFTKPLANDSDNRYSFINISAGMEISYIITKRFSVICDVSYARSMGGKDKYTTEVDGYSFKGDLIYTTFGFTVALSGCQYCK